ncbi:uncharacterized protein LOC143644021 [Tamandua tetradactyla]|uniref:uncharacterized protein LOC143644021 n=1 Tax=Tamandua tetradactyla TaxID=48850 RepID=UPI0040542977
MTEGLFISCTPVLLQPNQSACIGGVLHLANQKARFWGWRVGSQRRERPPGAGTGSRRVASRLLPRALGGLGVRLLEFLKKQPFVHGNDLRLWSETPSSNHAPAMRWQLDLKETLDLFGEAVSPSTTEIVPSEVRHSEMTSRSSK